MSADVIVDGAPRRRVTTWLSNPFYYIAGGQALAIGAVAILAGSLCNALTNSHFDGVLDFHSGASTGWWTYWVEGPIDWLVVSGLLLAGGKLLSQSRIRVLDVAGTQALARIPSLVMALMQLPPPVQRANQHIIQAYLSAQPSDPSRPSQQLSGLFESVSAIDFAVFGAVVLIVLAMLVWMVALMYRAFAVSCNVSGGKAIGVFIGLLTIGEIVSKIALVVLFSIGGM